MKVQNTTATWASLPPQEAVGGHCAVLPRGTATPSLGRRILGYLTKNTQTLV